MSGQENTSVTQDLLNAFVDGHLDEGERERIAEAIRNDAALAERVNQWQSTRDRLKALHDPVLDEPIPARFCTERNPGLFEPLKRRSLLPARIAASIAMLIFGGIMGWFGHVLYQNQTENPDLVLTDRALSAHTVYTIEVRHPVEVGQDNEQHLIAWLSKRLNHPLKAPDLSSTGFKLVGGRLLPAAGRPAAQLMYEDATGLRLTLYVGNNPSNKETAFRFVSDDGLNAFYWLDREIGYVIVAEVERDRLLEVTKLIYQAFGGPEWN